ncbi:hypothetical protein T4B_7505 [Trichinella pseudospiralis]|uniref:Uncharacterized protein n=2 Tax=Trichinella pseudospiralis TaxID=6337 RepID=A0A0V1JNE5_TRIPS|nr:hypothetical protein T4A_10250 [Trichinella pseudospiralis]KRY82527.1 hypothetical protein T4D_9376 [Trichinella pseudospiralis]KRZ22032.1 hypothetical protein T4B_7505 [Trichinella pseudospiralis]KRZ36429.1 hypothetical protein T4C_7556 [Trichinella pseudospiralis]
MQSSHFAFSVTSNTESNSVGGSTINFLIDVMSIRCFYDETRHIEPAFLDERLPEKKAKLPLKASF